MKMFPKCELQIIYSCSSRNAAHFLGRFYVDVVELQRSILLFSLHQAEMNESVKV